MPYIKANGIDIFYEYAGDGPPLVIIGGFASVHNIWLEYIKPLQKKYKVLVFDNRGFGNSEIPKPPYTIEEMVKDTIGLMRALSIESAYVMGHSMGSTILQRMCLDYPQKIKKAIISGTFLKIPYTSKLQSEVVLKLFEKNIDSDLIKEIILPWLYSSDFLKDREKKSAAIDRMKKIKVDVKGYLGQQKAMFAFDSTSWIDKIETPTLIVVGREDVNTPLYCAEEVNRKHKNSKLKIIERAAHMLYSEKIKETFEIMFDFFK